MLFIKTIILNCFYKTNQYFLKIKSEVLLHLNTALVPTDQVNRLNYIYLFNNLSIYSYVMLYFNTRN